MNKDNAKDYLPLVQALVDGKEIEFQGRDGWYALDDPSFDFPADRYRIKPELKEIWVNEYEDGDSFIHASEEAAYRTATARINVGRATTRRYREVIE